MKLLVECQGFRWGQVDVPKFTLDEGEAVCLHLPPVSSPHSKEWGERDLCGYFTGEISEAAVTILGVALRAIRPLPPRLFWFARNPRLLRWLTQHAGLSLLDAENTLRSMGLSSQTRLCDTSWTQRMLIALHAVLLRRPEVLVFEGWGLGDDGLEQMFELAARRNSATGVIYLSHPCSRPRPCFPHARCLRLQYRAPAHMHAA